MRKNTFVVNGGAMPKTDTARRPNFISKLQLGDK